jgi:ATP dependent DNA ligase domain
MARSAHSTGAGGHSSTTCCSIVEIIHAFSAFDLLMRDNKDCRRESLLDRKQELRRLLSGSDARIQYVDYVDGTGVLLFEQPCQHDLEGIVAKQKYAPYVTDRDASTWFKIRNPHYSQWAGRGKLFERERSREPVPGWHTCAVACAELEANPQLENSVTTRLI